MNFELQAFLFSGCLYRNVECPYSVLINFNFTKLANASHKCENVVFENLADHIKKDHVLLQQNVKLVKDVFEFQGSFEDLQKQICILESYGRVFTPVFGVKNDLLYIGLFLHGEQIEASQFKVHIKFFNEDLTTFGGHGSVKSIDDSSTKHFFIYNVHQFAFGSSLNEHTLFKPLNFTLKVVNEKLDEIARDEKAESGIDSDDEKTKTVKKEVEWLP